ncbi:NADH-quinone oxidoreductase subunit NuoB [Solidesulfovibrio sp.]|uniref:NADH-quinone oxidoreductase subunit NuoB n=1 Tax=Solidesulfovibrio sp. TaxID=2910990 RepID=UPI00261E110E|nr:NADH-quinone oxidoreductase subunit NuoB [Solidesulfovibrio sp.]
MLLDVWRKIITTGTVTRDFDAVVPPACSRGQVVPKAARDGACAACRKCEAACPGQAITVDGEGAHVDDKACLFCGRCVSLCPKDRLEQTAKYDLASLGGVFAGPSPSDTARKIRAALGRSLHIRHVDIGSCNACDFEMTHLCNPIYDVQQYGLDFVPSPRHADLLMVTGVVTRNSTQALQMTYEATPTPKLVMAVGTCACSGKAFGEGYAVRGAVDSIVPVDIYVPGCPPRPQAIIDGVMKALARRIGQ